MVLVEVQRACKVYEFGETKLEALADVDLSIDEGEFVAVWGPSGSGKSTLCHLIGLIDQPTDGKVLFDGRDVSEFSDDGRSELRSRKLGFVFQSFNLVPVLSALENVMLPLQLRGAGRDAKRRALDTLEQVGLSAFADHWPNKLSGGERQRVAIARALVTRPRLVVADEPTANLDTKNAVEVIELMRELGHSSGTAFLFATHDGRLLDRVDRKVQLRDGSIVDDVRLDAS
jgi:putative ABC transport system ATP-binding protein